MKVAIDVTPLWSPRPSGVSAFVDEIVGAFGREPVKGLAGACELVPYLISWNANTQDADIEVAQPFPRWRRRFPADLALRMWSRYSVPSAELWTGGGVEVLHGTNFNVPPSKRAQKRIITIHDLSAVHFAESGISKKLNLILRSIEEGVHVHVPSEAVARDLRQISRISEDHLHVIAHGIPRIPEETDESRAHARILTHDKPYFLAVGDIIPRKQFPFLIHSFFEFADVVDDVRLVIVGSTVADPGEYERVTFAASHPKFGSRVTINDWVPPDLKASLFKGASALVYPSAYEGFGFPVLEAQRWGIPVVATDAGAISETAGAGACLFAPRHQDGLTQLLIDVVSSIGLRQRVIQLGKENVRRFSWESCVSELLKLYSSRDESVGAAA